MEPKIRVVARRSSPCTREVRARVGADVIRLVRLVEPGDQPDGVVQHGDHVRERVTEEAADPHGDVDARPAELGERDRVEPADPAGRLVPGRPDAEQREDVGHVVAGGAHRSGAPHRHNQLSYSASASQASGDDSYAASGQYRGAYASVSASVSEGSGYSQQSLGATGGVVVHPGGITLANQMTDTIGVVEAIGAEGARVTNSVGTTINHSGYAVLPFLMPYRLNSINIDPDDAVSPDVEFKSTSESIAPRLNSVVMIRFQTVGGRAILITAHAAGWIGGSFWCQRLRCQGR